MCRACQHQSSVTAGTIFEKTRTPLRVWLAVAWYLTNQKQGVSALGLQRVLGLDSYQTAWTRLHRLRRAMVRPGREQLKGLVEVEETYLACCRQPKTDSLKSSVKIQAAPTLGAVRPTTRSPCFRCVTALPTVSITPLKSVPGV